MRRVVGSVLWLLEQPEAAQPHLRKAAGILIFRRRRRRRFYSRLYRSSSIFLAILCFVFPFDLFSSYSFSILSPPPGSLQHDT